jgi:Tfp pilus assembly PilM family ATPase
LSTRHAMAVDFGRRQLRAIWVGASRTRGGLKIRRALVEEVPRALSVDDPAAIGAWAGERLKAAGFPRGHAVILIGREHIVMKRLTLPTIEVAELPDMVRLAMSRELPFDLASAVVDFLPLESSGTSTTVLAVATSQAVIAHQRALAQAAGLSVGRIALRTLGVAALAESARDGSWALNLLDRSDSVASPECTLLIDVRSENIELTVVRRNVIDFSRAAEVPEPQDKLAIAEALVTETRRTWMSYQSSHESSASRNANPEAQQAHSSSAEPELKAQSSPLHEALLLGERRVCEYAAGPVGHLLGVRARVLDAPAQIETSGHDVDALWPLIGALLEETRKRQTIDFAHPRKAPDLGARARQRRLIAAGIAVVALIGAWTMARHQLRSLNKQAETLAGEQREQSPQIARYFRDRYKLEHLKKWESTSVDWLQHASYLTSIAPPPDRLVLEAWTGSLKFDGVKYVKGKWAANPQVTISIDGEAKDRATADGFRDTLVQSSVYEAETRGADARLGRRMPFAFTYTLRTRHGAAPPPPIAPPVDAQVVKANGGKP